MSVVTQGSKANIQMFMRQANLLQSNKVFFNKDYLKDFNAMENCFALCRQYLGKDVNFLDDATGVRLYLRDVFGPKSLRLFEDANGELVLDIEHALLFYYKLMSMNSPLLPQALGVVYFIAGHQLDDEFQQISKVAPRSRITPAFELHSQFFKWKRCNFVLRKYMLYLSKPDGYSAYYFEKPALGHISFMLNQGMSFEEAENTTRSASGGLFYTYLPISVENQLVPSFMSGGFETAEMDGYYKQTYIRDMAQIATGYTIDDVYNVYNMTVKQNMIELMGAIMNNVVAEAERNPYLSASDMSIYHVSPHRIGILVRDGVQLQHALPSLAQYFKPVPNGLDLSTMVQGEFL